MKYHILWQMKRKKKKARKIAKMFRLKVVSMMKMKTKFLSNQETILYKDQD